MSRGRVNADYAMVLGSRQPLSDNHSLGKDVIWQTTSTT
jgi:hypothetical protein